MVLLLAIWGFVVEPSRLRTNSYEISLDGWPAACDGLRIAVLADLHTGSPWNGLRKLDSIVERTLEAEPDLILLAGDYVIRGVAGGRFTPPEEIATRLADLTAPLGVWAVLGNHDWWLDGPRVRAAFEAVGIPVVDNTATELRRGSCAFWLVGIGDILDGHDDVRTALASVPEGAPAIAFMHNPDVFPDVPASVSLTIAGHTHGGQVYIPFVGRPIVPSEYGERYAIDHVVDGGRHLFVSPGLGTSIIPVRFLVPPEVSIVTVRSTALAESTPQLSWLYIENIPSHGRN